MEPGLLSVAFDVPESMRASVESGLAVEVSTKVAPGKLFHGTLTIERFPYPGSAGAPENNYKAGAEVREALPGIFPGVRARVDILLKPLEDVFILPRNAIFGTGNNLYCYVEKEGNGRFSKVKVTVYKEKGKEAVITKGLNEGERVLLWKD